MDGHPRTGSRAARHYVGDGMVGCPIRDRDLDVETCMRCPRLREFVSDPQPFVVCDGVTRESPLTLLGATPLRR